MKKIKIFLASSNELKPEREKFEIEIYRKCKSWFDKGIFLHLDIWEDMSARMSMTGSQSEYNKFVKDADIFVFLAYSKVGMYTAEEFENAFGQFKSAEKPFIFTYFKTAPENVQDSVAEFKKKLSELKHFYANFADSNDLWNQFNKELERLDEAKFERNDFEATSAMTNTITGDKNINIAGGTGNQVSINTGNTTHQQAEKIVNTGDIQNATFN